MEARIGARISLDSHLIQIPNMELDLYPPLLFIVNHFSGKIYTSAVAKLVEDELQRKQLLFILRLGLNAFDLWHFINLIKSCSAFY